MKSSWVSKAGLLVFFALVLFSCSSGEDDYAEVPKVSPVQCDLSLVPYPKLSDYQFFKGDMKNLEPVYGLLPYKPTSELFSDYALKKRFVWMPKNSSAAYVSDSEVLDLPVGAVLVKVFYYDHLLPDLTTKIIETRLMIRKSDGWIFAEYVWNDEQTEAYLQVQNTTRTLSLQQGAEVLNFTYKTPNTTQDCARCHGNIVTHKNTPIGIKPQNLNSNYNFSDGSHNQLTQWISKGYLNATLPAQITSVVNYNDASQPLDLRIRSYFDANCAHCHKDQGEAQEFGLRMEFKNTADPHNMGVGLPAQHPLPGYNGRLVYPNNPAQSILYYRLDTTTDLFYIMPAIGRTVKHREGLQLVEDWINSF